MKTCKTCEKPVTGLRSYCLTCRPRTPKSPLKAPRGAKKTVSRAKVIKNLDTEFSLYIRRHGKCEMCGCTEKLQCSHVLSRTIISLRWHPLNAKALCYHCHMAKWHKNPIASARWFEKKFPGRYDQLLKLQQESLGKKVDLDTVRDLWV